MGKSKRDRYLFSTAGTLHSYAEWTKTLCVFGRLFCLSTNYIWDLSYDYNKVIDVGVVRNLENILNDKLITKSDHCLMITPISICQVYTIYSVRVLLAISSGVYFTKLYEPS